MKTRSFAMVFLLFGFIFVTFSSKLGPSDSTEKDTTNSNGNQNESSESRQQKKNLPFLMHLINSAEVIVEGQVIGTENLYKRGGTFHQLLILKVDSTYKGETRDTQRILSRFGYTEKSHRAFIGNIQNIISYEKGDNGLFFLSRKGVIEQETAGNEKYKQFLKDKIGFPDMDEERDVLITKNNEFDLNYLQKVFPRLKMPTLTEFREELRLIVPQNISPH